MEIPICNGTYSNECKGHCVPFLKDLNVAVTDYFYNHHRPFFVSLCFYCRTPRNATSMKTLYRCGGCHLVSYCSKDCQKNDRGSHKYVCKEFPVVNGKNALFTTGSWTDHIAGLRKRADRLPQAERNAKPIFRNPGVCRTCWETQPDRLTCCSCCGCVSYCSNKCKLADKQHMEDCPQLAITSTTYTLRNMKYYLPSVKEDTICFEFELISDWDDVLPYYYKQQLKRLSLEEQKVPVGVDAFWTKERLSYPMSLLYALQSLPERRLGQFQIPLEDHTSLTIHVVISNPHFDSMPWEIFMHRLPQLKSLNIIFVIQGVGQKQSYGLNSMVTIGRCFDCQMRNRVITYSVHQMVYHMFFSSPEYTEPDVVVVYGNTNEMPSIGKDDIHSNISYRNMTNSKGTVLVLMDTNMKLVTQGVQEVNTTRPVDQLVYPRINPLKGFSSNRAEIESDSLIINERSFFACLRRR